ncbi:TPA: hypothetical protein ACH3X1_002313 [Trebouxia sp. C0004]
MCSLAICSSVISAAKPHSRLKLCDVDGVSDEQLQSLSPFAALQHLVLKGLDNGDDSGRACWSKARSWHELKAFQLTHLCLRSPNSLYQSPLGEGLMLLAPMPNMDYLHCKFLRFSVRSALQHDLAAHFRHMRSLPIRHLEIDIDIEEVPDQNEEVDSDDIDSELAYERAQEGQRMIQEH